MPIIIRATERDAAALAEFAARTFRDAFGAQNNPRDLEQFLATAYRREQQLAEIQDGRVDTLLAFEGADLVGFAQVREGVTPACIKADKAVELQRIYVDRNWHGHPIAAALMDAAKSAARARGGTHLWLGVWERNPRAQAFYRKHGFDTVGTHIFTVGTDPQTDVLMQCSLDESRPRD